MMPVQGRRIYQLPDLHPRYFHGMPGLIADSFPDKYGQRLIDVWLVQTGRKPEDFNAVDHLCYTGKRGMGALEFEPSAGPDTGDDKLLAIEDLTALASMAFASKAALNTKFTQAAEQTANGKDGLLAQYAGLPRGSEKQIIQGTVEAFTQWKAVAVDLGIPANLQQYVLRTLRLKL